MLIFESFISNMVSICLLIPLTPLVLSKSVPENSLLGITCKGPWCLFLFSLGYPKESS